MATDLKNHRRATGGGSVAIFNLFGSIFFYMWIKDSLETTAKKGDRFVSKGDIKSPTGQIDVTEWNFSMKWKSSEAVPINEEEMVLATELAEKLKEDPTFGYSEAHELARFEILAKK